MLLKKNPALCLFTFAQRQVVNETVRLLCLYNPLIAFLNHFLHIPLVAFLINSDRIMSEIENDCEKKAQTLSPTLSPIHRPVSESASPTDSNQLSLPSPIITRRTRTHSTSARALENPQETGKVKSFCRAKGHGFITSDRTKEDVFVHISDIEGEYIPLPGDEVEYRLCPIPPKFEKHQAVHVNIINLTPEVHLKWDSLPQ